MKIISNKVFLMSNPKQLHKINGIDMIHQLLSYEIFYLILSFFSGDVQSRVHVLGDSVNLSSMLEEKHNDVNIAQTGCDVQWCLLFTSASIDLGTVA